MKDNTSMSIPQNMGKYSMLMPIKIFLNSSEIFHITIPDWSEIGPRSVTVNKINQKNAGALLDSPCVAVKRRAAMSLIHKKYVSVCKK